MRDGCIEVAPGRFRETQGRYFDDFVVGHRFQVRGARHGPVQHAGRQIPQGGGLGPRQTCGA
ncbi:MAG: hypothetical protein ACK4MR_06565, partial [Erythrobacter cryptus]